MHYSAVLLLHYSAVLLLRNISKRDPTDENIRKYKDCRNKLSTVIRNAERNYYGNQLEISKDDSKRSWNIIKDIIGINNKSINNNYINIDDVIVTDSSKIANIFNKSLIICKRLSQ